MIAPQPVRDPDAETFRNAAAGARAPAGGWARDALRRRMLAGADVLALVSTLLAFGIGTASGPLRTAIVLSAFALAGMVWGKALRLYDRDHRVLRHGVTDEMPNLLAWTGGIAVAVAALGSAIRGGDLSGAGIAGFFAALLVGIIALRAGARVVWCQVTPPERVLIVGSGPLAAAMQRKLQIFGDLHFELVGCIDDAILHRPGGRGAEAFLDELAERHGSVDRILIAASTAYESLIAELIPLCRSREIKLGLVPPARGMFGTAVLLDHLAELPVVQYNTWDVSRTTQLGKRALDVAGALLALVLLLPALPAVALAIRLDSSGPVFFRQRRAGRDGRPFMLIKLRTMVRDAETRLAEVVAVEKLETPVFKLASDPRMTRLGRWLRKSSLDELPQLWNVLRGDMSLVGPRPEQLDLVERYAPHVRSVRLAVKPGLTGPMQVSGRGALKMEERLAVEREYVENQSITRDLQILVKTASAVLRGRGAY